MTTRKDILKINLIIVVNPTTYLWIFMEFFFNGCRKLKRKTASSLILVGHVVFVLLIECRVIKGKIDLIFTWMFYRFRDHEYNELMPGGLNAHHFEFAFFMWSILVFFLCLKTLLCNLLYTRISPFLWLFYSLELPRQNFSL